MLYVASYVIIKRMKLDQKLEEISSIRWGKPEMERRF